MIINVKKHPYFKILIWSVLLQYLIFNFSTNALAGLFIEYAFNYHSNTDDADTFAYNTMRNQFFLGASIGKSDQIILGQNVMLTSKSTSNSSSSTSAEFSVMELGPKVTYYFDQMRTFGISLAYNPYVKGTRTTMETGTAEEISGSSIFVAVNYQLKMTKQFYLGASLNYHSIAISQSIVGPTETKISETNTSIYPAIIVSFRFK